MSSTILRPRGDLSSSAATTNVQREWLKAVCSVTVYVGFKQLKPDNRELGCIGCKAKTHPSWACPYPTKYADHWLGLTADEYNKVLKNPLDWKQDRKANIDGPSPSNNHEFTPIPAHYRGHGHGGFQGGRGGRGWNATLRGYPVAPRGHPTGRG
ncbi:hypothetical protein C8R41DRAFT_918464 [Lentinula lateritia]|uniref:Uncharacterized protein n=1 Tax=Lentinula lateritia TaxID=40482 RepID=A0ABQ8VM25_9AGAR|nr:hypothetical protein C8R41DRAFT_918464 [Lentinula lateritia]